MIERIERSKPVRSAPAVMAAKGVDLTPERFVSSGSNILATARALAAQPAPVDQARVDDIRQAIRDGRYPLDPQAIARAMQDRDHG